MPTSVNPSQFPDYIYGLHDIGGQVLMLKANRIGWLLDVVDLSSQIGTDYTRLTEAGLSVMVRLNYGYDPVGTLPPSDHYDAFAAECAEYVANSQGPRVWIIGNEMNTLAERPELPDGTREIITPELYAQCFRKCRAAIKSLVGHENDLVIPGAVAPYDDSTGDWIDYFGELLRRLDSQMDGIALHCYTHDFDPAQITSETMMDPPYAQHHYDFRAYRDFLQAVPAQLRVLPVWITEACPYAGWQNANRGWIQAAYQEIDTWNADPMHQPIQALCLYRWQTFAENVGWGIQDKLYLQDDFSAALKPGYHTRWTPPEILATLPEPIVPFQLPALDKVSPPAPGEPEAISPDASPPALAEPDPPPAPRIILELASRTAPTPAGEELPAPSAETTGDWEAEPGDEEPARAPEPAPLARVKPWAAKFLAHDTPVALVVGQTGTVNLRIKNCGSAPWMQTGVAAVHLAYKWFDTNRRLQRDVEDRRTALPHDVAGDAEVAVGAWLCAPKTPGTYTLCWDLIASGHRWFAEVDSPAFSVPVAVTVVPQDITGWRVEASANIAQVAHALDGDPMTFWENGAPQCARQWFRINLDKPRWMDGIQFLSPGRGFPAAYVLRVSADGAAWTELARVAGGNPFDVMAMFAPMRVQYAQIDLLDAAESAWLISEILIHPATAWTVTASHNAEMVACAVDNRAETAWTSGANQKLGMWFQIDLGRVETVSGLALVAPADGAPAGLRVAVWDAQGNRWQVVHELKNNVAPVEIAFAATQTQFINLQLTQASERQWAIQHARVIREMEEWLGPA